MHGQRRREFLRIGSLVGTGLTLPLAWAGRARGEEVGESAAAGGSHVAKSCILVWLDGGPSHIDTWDPKPEAPEEVRGPFGAIKTAVPGVSVSELFPALAARLDRVTLVRSMTSPLGEHNLGAQYLLTGYRPSPVLEYPPFMATLASCQAEGLGRMDGEGVSDLAAKLGSPALPQSVAVPNFRVGGASLSPHGFLPAEFAPFSVEADPARPDFAVRHLGMSNEGGADRLRRRRAFRGWLETGESLDALTEQAFALLGSTEARRAFALDEESAAMRARYGPRTVGQSCLLARRLVEAGVPLVSVIHHGWDTHADLVTRLRDGFTGSREPVGLGPTLDRALAALMDDLQERGLWDETLLVVMGEFGRTPKWNAGGGRDHWPRVFSVMLAGGPIEGGRVVGASDRYGESPEEDPVTPGDLCHTILASMGIDPATVVQTPDGRPIRLAPEGSRRV